MKVAATTSRLVRGRRLISMTTHRLRLYDYAASCNCYKVRLLLAHLAIAYERVPVDIFAGETLSADYARINPMRTTPVLQTEDGRHLPDSNAILLYLARGTAYLPEEPLELAQIVRWLIYEQTDVVPMIGGLRFRLLTGRLAASDPDAVRRRTGAGEVLALLDEHLAVNDFFVAGRYTIADVAIYGYAHRAGEAQLDLEPYDSIRSWLGRVERQPGYLEDLQPYGANAAPRAGESIYD
jgi:glutathione S-transferase